MRELADEAAELFGQRHVGLQLGRFLGADSDGMLSALVTPPVTRIVGHLLGHLQRDVDLRLGGRGAEVRGADEVRRAEQRLILGRLGREHVERGAGDVAADRARP